MASGSAPARHLARRVPRALASARQRARRLLRPSAGRDGQRLLDDRLRHIEGAATHTRTVAEQTALLGDQLALTLHDQHTRLRTLERHASIRAVMWWIEAAPVPEETLVSVILATRNRAGVLLRAVESVCRQEYGNWQLVIIDDGSTDETAARCAELRDSRIDVLHLDHAGACAARNAGLDKACGQIVTYLDDDNLMHPLWLKSVVWAFEQHPDVGVLYGARLADNEQRLRDGTGPATDDWTTLPYLHFEPFDRDLLERTNLVDTGVIAHRAGLPEASFDERLERHEDWDLLLRLTCDQPPLELPAIANLYTTDRGDRVTVTVDGSDDGVLVRDKVRSGRSGLRRPGPEHR